MSGDYFISYSRQDGADHAGRVHDTLLTGLPRITAWLDQHQVRPDRWDDQIEQAIAACRALLLVLTPQSVTSAVVKSEWSTARSFNRPIILLRFSDVEPPMLLKGLQEVDFRDGFGVGMAGLRNQLRFLDTEQGQLAGYEARLESAVRERSRIPSDQRGRLDMEIADMEELLRPPPPPPPAPVRAPEQPPGRHRVRTVNRAPYPLVRTFQDRNRETERIADFLGDPEQRMLIVVGRAGAGKTAMACRALYGLAEGSFPGGAEIDTTFEVVVFLGGGTSRAITVPALFDDLCRLLPETDRAEVEQARRAATTTRAACAALADAFADRSAVVLLDNFEDLMEPGSGRIRNREVAEALVELLRGPHHGIKMMITTRELPEELALVDARRQDEIALDEGLPVPDAVNLLRSLDDDGRVGLRDAPEDLLRRVVERTLGLPKALEAVFIRMRADRFTRIEDIVAAPRPPDHVVEAFSKEAVSHVEPYGQSVLRAVAAFSRPVPAAAVGFALASDAPQLVDATLRRLARMRLVRFDGDAYSLHPVDVAYHLDQLEPGEPGDWADPAADAPTLTTLRHRGAEYLRDHRPAAVEGRADLEMLLAEFDMRSLAGDLPGAIDVLVDIGDVMLELGYARMLLDLAEGVRGRASDEDVPRLDLISGYCLARLGHHRDAATTLRAVVDHVPVSGAPELQIPPVRLELASCLTSLRELAAAVDEYDLVLEASAGDPELAVGALLGLAHVARLQADVERAAFLHGRALAAALRTAFVVGDGPDDADPVEALDHLAPGSWEVLGRVQLDGGATASAAAFRIERAGDGAAVELVVLDTLVADVWLDVARRCREADDLAGAQDACMLAGVLYDALGQSTLDARTLLQEIRAELAPSDDDMLAEQEEQLADARRRGDLAEEAMVLATVGYAYFERRRLGDAEGAFRDLDQLGRERGSASDLVTAGFGLAKIAWLRDEYDSALGALVELLDGPAADDLAYRAEIHLLLGNIEMSRTRQARAVEHFGRARELFDELEDPTRLIDVDRRLADVDTEHRRYDVALRRLEDAAGRARSIGIPSVLSAVLGDLVTARLMAGDRAGALEGAAEAQRLAEEMQRPATAAELFHAVGRMHTELEDFDAAARAHQVALDVYRELGRRAEQVDALHALGFVFGEAGRYVEELDVADAALGIARELGDPTGVRTAEMNRALALADLGRHEEASALIGPLLAADPDSTSTLGNAAWTAFLAGRHEESLALGTRALELDPTQLWIVRNQAQATMALGRPDEAERLFRRAIDGRCGGETFVRVIREVRNLLDRDPSIPRGGELLAMLEAAQAELA
ncbi:MAG: TIR domain-containing protein [Pseudonocardia sp.]